MNSETHFLVVDDYSNIRSLVRAQLLGFGFSKVTEKEDAEKAIAYLESPEGKSVNFVISDWNMPGKTGLDLLKWVRANDPYKNLPFLILTTENEQAKIMSAIQFGVSNFLLKPWETEELGNKIQLCWKKHNK